MRKEKLINAIRETIIDLETGRKVYEWCDASCCNCGILAQNICGISREELDRIPKPVGVWREAVNCDVTGMPIADVYKKMFEAGLTVQDVFNIENLADEKVLAELGVSRHHYFKRSIKENVIKYFQAWLRILEREQPAPAPEPQYRFIEKHESIKPLLEKTIQLS